MNRFALLLAAGASAVAISSAVQAADLIIEEPVEAGIVDVSGSWDGVYVGVFVGAGAGELEDNGPLGGVEDISGWLVGANVGADFTVTDGIVAGVVADIAWSDIGADFDFGDTYSFSADWLASIRGKLGFDGGAFLPYLTAGLAVAGISAAYAGGPDFDEDHVHVGWTVGAGVEFAVTEDVSVDLLYRYSDYGTQTYGESDGAPYESSFNTHQVSIGLNWRF